MLLLNVYLERPEYLRTFQEGQRKQLEVGKYPIIGEIKKITAI